MKKILQILLLFIVTIYIVNASENANKKLIFAINPISYTGENEEYKSYEKIITDILGNEFRINKFDVIIMDNKISNEKSDQDELINSAKSQNADILIYGIYDIQKNKIKINLSSCNVANSRTFNSRTINIDIKSILFVKNLKFYINDYIDDEKSLYKYSFREPYHLEQYQNAFDLSVGFAISPEIYWKFSSVKKIYNDNEIIYQIQNNSPGVGKFIPVSISFSYTYFINQTFGIGFSLLSAYSSGIYSASNANYKSDYVPPIYMNSIMNDFSIRLKKRSLKGNIAFISEFGILSDIEILNSIVKYNTNVYPYSFYSYEGNLFIGLGPIVALGFEGRKNNFSFELLGFVAGTFGWKSTDTLNVIDPQAIDLNIQYGIILKFNYYYFHILKK